MVWALLVACTDPIPELDEGLEADGLFVTARAVVAGPLRPPASLYAPTPDDPAGMLEAGAPSWEEIWLRVRYEDGLADVLGWANIDNQAFLRAVNTSNRTCAQLSAVTTESSPLVQIYRLAGCGDPAHTELMEHAFPEGRARWGVSLHSKGHAVPLFVWEVALPLAENLGADNDLIDLLGTLETDRPELADTLVALTKKLPDAQVDLGSSMLHQQDPRLKGLQQRLRAMGIVPGAPDVLLDPDGAIRSGEFWVPNLLLRYPDQRGSLLAAVERCASDPSEAYAEHCLHTLAAFEWGRGQRIAGSLSDPFGPTAKTLFATLRRFSDRAEVERHLDSLGFPPTTEPRNGPNELVVTAADVLALRGQTASLHANSSNADLAGTLVRSIPDLAAVRIQEVAPPVIELLDEAEVPTALGFLRAWEGTQRSHVLLRNAMGFREPSAIVGLLNTLLAERESPTRIAFLEGRDTVVFGPRAGLEALHEEGLLALALP